jgi:hypothetical protein
LTLKVADTDQLTRIAQEGLDRGYNRRLNLAAAEAAGYTLDPKGLHVLDDLLLHEHAGGRKVPAHVRCWVVAKMLDSDEPVTGIVDVSIERWNDLPTVETALERKELARALELAEKYPKPSE